MKQSLKDADDVTRMSLNEIRDKLTSLPTIMEISDELLIIDMLMKVEFEELIEGKSTLFSILDDIELSHNDVGFLEITKENEGEFVKFYNWLKKINSELNLGISDCLVDSFSDTEEDIERLISETSETNKGNAD